MTTLSGFWHAAARMTGRIDFSHLLAQQHRAGPLNRLSGSQLQEGGLSPAQARILRHTPAVDLAADWITIEDSSYPDRLRRLPYAPPVLFYRGALSLLEQPSLAIVGARRCTGSGESWAMRLSRRVVESGRVVVSGLAQGIDSAAHRAADGHTVAVLGHGLSAPMSWARHQLAERLLSKGGLLLTEFLPHFPPSRWTFPQRNRVIAGLAEATLVVEAGARSGSLITARHALDAGREVWAVPGHPSQSSAQGCIQLLRDGATLIGGIEDLEDAMGISPGVTHPKDSIWRLLERGITLEELAAETGRDPADLHVEISRALMLGRVQRLPGDRFISGAKP